MDSGASIGVIVIIMSVGVLAVNAYLQHFGYTWPTLRIPNQNKLWMVGLVTAGLMICAGVLCGLVAGNPNIREMMFPIGRLAFWLSLIGFDIGVVVVVATAILSPVFAFVAGCSLKSALKPVVLVQIFCYLFLFLVYAAYGSYLSDLSPIKPLWLAETAFDALITVSTAYVVSLKKRFSHA